MLWETSSPPEARNRGPAPSPHGRDTETWRKPPRRIEGVGMHPCDMCVRKAVPRMFGAIFDRGLDGRNRSNRAVFGLPGLASSCVPVTVSTARGLVADRQ